MKEGGTSLHKTIREINLAFKGLWLMNRNGVNIKVLVMLPIQLLY